MRKSFIVSGLVVLFSSSAFAAQPNMYSCKDVEGKYEVGYTTTSWVGTPTLHVYIDGVSVDSEHTTSTIQHDTTVLGNLVSLLVDHVEIADAPTRAFSLLVPDLRTANTKFATKLLVGSIGGFTSPETPVQRVKEVVTLTCTASQVYF